MASLPTRRRYKFNQAPVVTTLATSMDAGATAFTLTSGTNWPAAGSENFWVTIGAGTATEERILCSGAVGTTVTVASSGRGQDGTSAQGHNQGDSVWVSWSATDADESNAHVSSSASTANINVHGLGVGSSVVGTDDSQTLTNKTLTAPKVSGTSSGTTVLQGAATASGTITIPAATDTLVGRATTDTLTNKTLTAPAISGTSSGTTVIQGAATASGTITIPAATDTLVGRATTDTLTNKTLTAPAFSGASSGTTVVQASAVASGTLTLPAATDTLVGKATTDNLTNKTLTGASIDSTSTLNAVSVGLITNPPRCKIFKSAVASVPDATYTLVTWNSEDYDTDTMHNTSSQTSRIVATTAGLYMVTVQLAWASNATGGRAVDVRKNSAGSATGGTRVAQAMVPAQGNTAHVVAVTFDVQMSATDYLEFFAWQSSGGALNLYSDGSSANTFAQARWVAVS